MARKGRAVNRRKPSAGGRKPLVALLLVVALIVLAFFLLEHFRSSAPPAEPVTGADQTPHLRLPERPVPQQGKISSASVPVAKPHVTAATPRPKGPGQVAIIIDDMGSSMQELQAFLSIRLPLTFSVIPSLGHAKGVSEGAHLAGAEVMVHMPMEPEGYPKQPLEKIGLLLNMGNPEIQERVNSYFRTVPHAVGANNHMGSRFTQNAEKMEVVLKVLKGKGVFFVDSKTSPASVGYQTARAMGLKCGVRQVFLDNVQDEAAIAKQLAEVAAIARRKGAAIAICHPHPSTIRALQSVMPELAKSGITFVYASALTS
ncbi:MAG: hypothetical protein A2075_24735 [Geobacteraceae bacterium GWC2_58_44]|nr:MAG: hypothetical protein A2075_24735 [Geobacteraceae bacterium GWC2_58_44]HBG06821.1 hypothetical protein [Geobacter sp.]